MTKAVDAFRTIGEVSEALGVPKHVLRFWESKFPQIKPMKRGGGRRFYRPEDVALLIGIHRLLHFSGYTIKGVQRILREEGAEAVKAAGRMDPAISQRSAKVAAEGFEQQPEKKMPRKVRPGPKSLAELACNEDLLKHLTDVARELEQCLKLARPDPEGITAEKSIMSKAAKKKGG